MNPFGRKDIKEGHIDYSAIGEDDILNEDFRTFSFGTISEARVKQGSLEQQLWLLKLNDYERLSSDTKRKIERLIKEAYEIGQSKSLVTATFFQLLYPEIVLKSYLVVNPLPDAVSLQSKIQRGDLQCDNILKIINGLVDVIQGFSSAARVFPVLFPDSILIENDNIPVLFDLGYRLQIAGWQGWLNSLSLNEREYYPFTLDKTEQAEFDHLYPLAVLVFEMVTGIKPLSSLEQEKQQNLKGIKEHLYAICGIPPEKDMEPDASSTWEERKRVNLPSWIVNTKEFVDLIFHALTDKSSASRAKEEFQNKLRSSISCGGDGQKDAEQTQLNPLAREDVQKTQSLSKQATKKSKKAPSTSTSPSTTEITQIDEILVEHPRRRTKPVSFDPALQFLMAGFDRDNKIRLDVDARDAAGISARHFCIWRLEDGGYTITDVGPEITGAYHEATQLNSVPLSPYFAAHLTSEDKITLGEYTFRLQKARVSSRAEVDKPIAELTLLQSSFIVQPGDNLTIPFQVEYLSNVVEDFRPHLDNAPSGWSVTLPNSIRYPGVITADSSPKSEGMLQLRFPKVERTSARTYNLVLRLLSTVRKVQVAAHTIRVQILNEYRFSCKIEPTVVHTRDVIVLSVRNRGNFTTTFVAHWSDSENKIRFESNDSLVTVRPGQVGNIYIEPSYAGIRILGGKKNHQITVEVSPEDGGEPQSVTGQVISSAWFPPWFGVLAIFLLAMLILLSTTVLKPAYITRYVQIGSYKVAAPVAGMKAALIYQASNDCFRSVYVNDLVVEPIKWSRSISSLTYTLSAENPNDIVEIRLRNCLLVTGDIWQVKVVAPTPMPEPPRIAMIASTSLALVGAEGNYCIGWEVTPITATVTLQPINLQMEKENLSTRKKCFPYTELFQEAVTNNYFLEAFKENGESVRSTPVTIRAIDPVCSVAEGPLRMRTGPSTNFDTKPVLLQEQSRVRLKTRPFYAADNPASGWVQVTVVDSNDPRVAWLDYAYLNCSDEIKNLVNTLPLPQEIPSEPTATPTPTLTSTATPAPLPTATPGTEIIITVNPPVINQGECAVLTWKIQNVKEVYINGEGVNGESERPECKTQTTEYKFLIKLSDGSTKEITKVLVVNSVPGQLPPPVQQ